MQQLILVILIRYVNSWVKQLLTQLYTGILSIISKVKAKKNLKVKLQRASTHI